MHKQVNRKRTSKIVGHRKSLLTNQKNMIMLYLKTERNKLLVRSTRSRQVSSNYGLPHKRKYVSNSERAENSYIFYRFRSNVNVRLNGKFLKNHQFKGEQLCAKD